MLPPCLAYIIVVAQLRMLFWGCGSSIQNTMEVNPHFLQNLTWLIDDICVFAHAHNYGFSYYIVKFYIQF